MTERYYREVDGVDHYGEPCINMYEFKVIKRTPKGVWIVPSWSYNDDRFKRFVLDGIGRRYAYPSKELARESYIVRKRREIQHAAHKHDKAVKLLALARGETPEPPAWPVALPICPQ